MDDYVSIMRKIREALEQARKKPDRGTYTSTLQSGSKVVFPVKGK